MAGGDISRFQELSDIVKPYTKSITRLGEAGAGQTAKMCNQIAIAGVVQGVAEALHFAKCADLDPTLVLNAISGGAAGSWQMSNRWPTMAEGKYDFGFAVDWMRKDLGIALDEARQTGRISRWRLWSTSSIPKSRPWAARAGIPRPCTPGWKHGANEGHRHPVAKPGRGWAVLHRHVRICADAHGAVDAPRYRAGHRDPGGLPAGLYATG